MAARALRSAGHLVVWTAQHVFPRDGDSFFAQLQKVYDAIEGDNDRPSMPAPGELSELTSEIDRCGQFDVVAVDHFDWTVDYTAESYINLLRTFSGHLAMAPADRERLFSEIRRRVALRTSGSVRRGWGAVLHIARKREDPSSCAGVRDREIWRGDQLGSKRWTCGWRRPSGRSRPLRS